MGTTKLPPDADGASNEGGLSRSRRTFVALLDQAVVSGTNFLVAAAVGRFCGVEQLGFYALGFSLLILMLSVHEGLILTPYTILRGGLGSENGGELAGNALIMSVCFAAIVMVCLGLIGLVGRWSGAGGELWKVMLTVSISAPFVLWRDFARRMELAELRVRSAAIVDALAAMVQLGFIAALIGFGRLDATGAILAMGAGCAVAVVLWFLLMRYRFDVRRSNLRQGVSQSVRLGGWITATRLANVAGNQSVPWLLALRLGVTATGGFAAANSIVSVSNPILMGLGSIHLPEAVNDYAKGGFAALSRSTLRITRLMGTTALVFAFVILLAAAPILRLAYGSGFDEFALVAVILAGGSLASVLGFGAETGLRILERPRFDFVASAMMLIVTVTTTFLLADRLGAAGGAIGVLSGAVTATAVRRVAFARLSPSVAQVSSHPLESNS